MIYEEFTFFYRSASPFSNWFSCSFRDDDGVVYNCSEQYMMAEKAKLFGDDSTAKKILAALHPWEQKSLGRTISNFDKKTWEDNAKKIVYRGCYFKFTQNAALLDKLIETTGTLLVEASPTDTVWGIGMSENDPNCHDQTKWKGSNWLGEVLTELRDNLTK